MHTASHARIDVPSRRFNLRRGSRPIASGPSRLLTAAPTWFESLLFVALMSGPPKFTGDRDVTASLAGEIDLMVLVQIGVWTAGALWVFSRLCSSAVKRGVVPTLNSVQIIACFLIAALSLSLPQSPGVMLTAFTLGQYCVMLSFA